MRVQKKKVGSPSGNDVASSPSGKRLSLLNGIRTDLLFVSAYTTARCDSMVHNGGSHILPGKRRLKLRQSSRLCRGSRNASPISASATCPQKQAGPVFKKDLIHEGELIKSLVLGTWPSTWGVFHVFVFFIFFFFLSDLVFGAVTAEVHQKLEVLNATRGVLAFGATEKVGVTDKNIWIWIEVNSFIVIIQSSTIKNDSAYCCICFHAIVIFIYCYLLLQKNDLLKFPVSILLVIPIRISSKSSLLHSSPFATALLAQMSHFALFWTTWVKWSHFRAFGIMVFFTHATVLVGVTNVLNWDT